jgi:hypothetical protein
LNLKIRTKRPRKTQSVSHLPLLSWRVAVVQHGTRAGLDLIDYRSPDQDHAGRDFLLERRAPDGVEMIVTNPPGKLAAQFAAHALSLCPRVAMLLRLSFLESGNEKTKAGRARLFALDGGHLARVFVFIDRLPMMHRDGWAGNRAPNAVAFAWFVWERGYVGNAELDRISWNRGAS